MNSASKYLHFYLNKYVVTPLVREEYYLSYNFEYKILWYRVPKVASRTIHYHLYQASPQAYVYSSPVGYVPGLYRNYFKFSFVRHPVDRFLSAWRDKVLRRNYFNFDNHMYSQMQELENFLSWAEELEIENCDMHLCAQHKLIDLNNFDFLGRFENFTEDFWCICQMTGLPVREIAYRNSSKRPDLHKAVKVKDISKISRSRIESIYEKDMQLFYPNG